MKDGVVIRRTGLSTAIAFETIAEAIRNPGKTIRVIDHYQETDSGDRNLYNIILRIVEHMDLKFEMKKSKGRFTIKSEWYGIAVNTNKSSWKILNKKDITRFDKLDW